MALGGLALVILAIAGRSGIVIAGVFLTGVGAVLATMTAALATSDILIESADPYGYATGPRMELVGFALMGLLPAAIVGTYGVGHLRGGRSRARRRATLGTIGAAALLGVGVTTIGFSMSGPPPNPRAYSSSPPGYRVVLPRGFEVGGTYRRPLLFIVSVSGGFSLPGESDWFDELESYEIQMSVQPLPDPGNDLAASEAFLARADESLGYEDPVQREETEVYGRPAVRRVYITETSRQRAEEVSVCALLYECTKTTVEAWTDRRFFLHYDGPKVHVVRVVTVVDGQGWVLSMYAAPTRRDADRLFAAFLSTFEPSDR
jgi:hypothetical protein